MPISNVALTNTFNEWRVRTNEVIVAMNDVLNDGLVTYRDITANVITANNLLFSSGANVVAVLNSSFDKANTGVRTGWTTLVANNPISQVSITPASNNDTLTLRTTGNVSITGVSANDNVIFDLTDTTVAAGSYGSSSAVPVITVDSKGRLTTVTTASIDTAVAVSAFDKANSANIVASAAFDKANSAAQLAFGTVVANGTSLVADSNNDTLTLRTTGNVSITGVSANDNVIFDLTTTGVTSCTYGGWSSTNFVAPSFFVDARGRITSGANVIIQGTTNQITLTGSAGTVTLSTPQSTHTSASVQFGSFGVGTAASGTTGEIRATNDITAFYSSDARLKTNIRNIENPLDKLNQINGVYFDWTNEYLKSKGGEDSYFVRKNDIGVIAQEVEKVLPEVVGTRSDGMLAVKYDRIVALLIEAVKEQQKEIEKLKTKIRE